MNQYSEVEAKFDGEKTTAEAIKQFADNVQDNPVLRELGYRNVSFKLADGTDSFYKMGEGKVRYRFDNITGTWAWRNGKKVQRPVEEDIVTMFTVKERRSEKNIFNRKEVDISLSTEVSPDDIDAFMKLMGGEFLYAICKEYRIWEIESKKLGVKACFAAYDVYRPNGKDPRTFIEIEIERSSSCSAAEGHEALKVWIGVLKDALKLNDPVNVSLAELYEPK
jgi:hypothetical protein